MRLLLSIYHFTSATRRIWIARFLVFFAIAGLSFIPYIGIYPTERTYDPGMLETLPYNYTFWVFNRFLWFPMSFFSGFDGYPWQSAPHWGVQFGLTVLWWAFLSFAITTVGEYLLIKLIRKNNPASKS